MTIRAVTAVLACLLFSTAVAAQQSAPDTAMPRLTDDSQIVAEGATPHLVSRQFSFTEGASVDKKGNVFFTDQPNNKIWEYSTRGRLSVFMDSAGRSNGMYFDHKGNLVTCADEHDQLWSVSRGKKITVLVHNFRGRLLNGPNDVWVDPRGGMYFTDPYYQRPYWTRTSPDLKGQDVYYLAPGATEPVIADSQLVKPNGIVGSADGHYLYVADIEADKTYRYAINADGSLFDKTLFVSKGSDGMTLDAKGNVYVTGDGVTVFSPSGKQIAHIPIPEKWTANLCFGGKKKKTLFITASEGIYTLHMRVKGIE